ncbi:RES family NAD+ phosphorylase [Pantoea sp. S-LA4]|uniref:RES family NAD+ phosphorylase n=1 Tax=Pantoea TaxID=53335 RepID=UPI001F1C9546|nr:MULTISPECIES: RES family NAD+ phosphorylase [Pantoea]UIL50679.1 RES family NAD+ phosphorylase [Pantoea agglomerans]
MASVHFYRLVKSEYAMTAFDGFGARTYGGRWNSVGTGCVYLGSSRALCVLEALVHLTIQDLAQDYSMLSISVPDSLIAELSLAALPADWQADPAPPSTREIGDGWLANPDNGLILKVPSTLTGEWNALLNPAHPAAAAIISKVVVEPFFFDPRFRLQ